MRRTNERRHEELLDYDNRQSEALEEANRLAEEQLYELRIAEEQAEAHREEQRRLAAERLELEKKRIEEARDDRQRRSEQECLRAALPEFSLGFREQWTAISRMYRELAASSIASRNKLLETEAEQRVAHRALSAAEKKRDIESRSWLVARIESGSLRWPSGDHRLRGFEQRLEEIRELLGSTPSSSGGASMLTQADEPVQVLRSLMGVHSGGTSHAADVGPRPGLGCSLSLAAIVVMSILESLIRKLLPVQTFRGIQPGLTTVLMLIVVGPFAWFVVGAPIRNWWITRTGRERHSKLMAVVRETLGDYEKDGGVIGSNPTEVLLKLVLEALPSSDREKIVAHQEWLGWSQRVKSLEEAKRSLTETHAQLQSQLLPVASTYAVLRSELLRVGGEIVEGIRMPGSTIEILNCPSCGGSGSTEQAACSYCGAVRSISQRGR